MESLLQVEARTWLTLGVSLFLLIGGIQVLADQRSAEAKDRKPRNNRK